MKKLLQIICIISLVLTFIGCSTSKDHNGYRITKADYYFFGEMIKDEANGKPAMPVNGTWENYWKERYTYLRSHRARENAEQTIRWIETSRVGRGLKPIE